MCLTGLGAHGAPKPSAKPTAPAPGERGLFDAQCGICHGETGYATAILAERIGRKRALLAARTDLDGGVIRSVVRNGTGNMPPQTRVDLSDADLDRIIAYLTRERAGRPPPPASRRE
jgi:mono/diheme cytochrome c family protein